jgi:phosphatidylglycerophosphatase A
MSARGARPAAAVATCLGLGFFPVAPGTLTSLVVAVGLGLVHAPLSAARGLAGLAVLGVLVVVGGWAAGGAERRYGHDARRIVIDEAAGMLLSALWVPWTWLHLGAAFVLFRAFDVLKPPPAYQLQSLSGGAGVMADDIAAGLYAVAVLALLRALVPGF